MIAPALIFDLDGMLVDRVYQHVLAWHGALQETAVELAAWRTRVRGGLVRALRDTGCQLSFGGCRRTDHYVCLITQRMLHRSKR